MRLNAAFGALLFVFALAGCRGSGGSGMVPSLAQGAKASGTASFTISVPPPIGNAPATMQSLSVTLLSVDGAPSPAASAEMKMNLTKTTPGCASAADGTLTCTVRFSAPAGNDTFSVTTFAQPNRTGAQVSSDRVTTSISAGRATTCVKKSSGSSATSKTAQAAKS